MFNVYYHYETTERLRVYKGFECKHYIYNRLVDKYNTVEEAKKHKASPFEKDFPKGYYIITKENFDEKIEN